jgi:hypothetical protein
MGHLALLSGCVGLRTPLDDAARPRPNGTDSAPSTCGSTITIDTTTVVADILIVLDRSESMIWSLTDNVKCPAAATGCSTRAEAVVSAVDAVVTEHPSINWGLALFPAADREYCVVLGTPEVPVGPDTATAIKSELAALPTSFVTSRTGSTPTAAAIDAAVAYLKTVEDPNNKAILLATDGLPNCGNPLNFSADGMPGATGAAEAARAAGFPVYVIGLGPRLDNLNSLAEAGGTGSYFPATSTTALNAALGAITRVVTSTCTIKANAIPIDKDLVTVYVEHDLVAQDESEGWTFAAADPTYATVVLHGSHCERVLAGVATEVQLVFGCADAGTN